MHRSATATAGSALLTLLFLAGGAAEAYGLHTCPLHHDSVPVQHARSAVSDAVPDSDAGAPEPHFCTCVGSCHGGAATPVPQLGPTSALAHSGPSARMPQAGTWFRPRGRVAYLLPFPLGPPLP